jgi:hypothetical protein
VHILLTAEAASDQLSGVCASDVDEFHFVMQPEVRVHMDESRAKLDVEESGAASASEDSLVLGHCYVLTADSEPNAVLLESG